MTETGRLRVAGVVVLGVLLLISGDLWWAWRHSPFDRGGWAAAAIWLVWAAWLAKPEIIRGAPKPAWLVAAIGMGLLSFVGQLNVAGHAALALTVAAWMPTQLASSLVVMAGASWFPALGWISTKLELGEHILWLRFAYLGLAVVAGFFLLPRKEAA